MNTTAYTPKLAADVTDDGRFISVLSNVHLDKRVFANAIAEAFINGMIAQERLAAAEREVYQRKEAAIAVLLDAGLCYDTIKVALAGEGMRFTDET